MRKRDRWLEMDKSETPLESLRLTYEADNRACGKSPHTVDTCNRRLNLFLRWLRETGRRAQLGDG